MGSEQEGRNEQRQGNGYRGMDYSRDSRDYHDDRGQYRNRSISTERVRFAPSRVRVLHEIERGRSMTHHYGRPFCFQGRLWLAVGLVTIQLFMVYKTITIVTEKLARLSEVDKIALIRSLKRSKGSKKN